MLQLRRLIPLLLAVFHFMEEAVYGEEYVYYDLYTDNLRPSFLDVPREFTAKIGDKVTFPCNVDETEFVMTFSYVSNTPRRGGKSLYFAGDADIRKKSRFKKEGSNYILTTVRRSDAGVYICKIETTVPVELQHKLIVQFAPKANLVGKLHRSVVQGTTLVLQCAAEGVPRPTITWRKVGGKLPTGTRTYEGFSLTINNVGRDAEGNYTCTADNEIGEPSTAQMVTVIVEYPPIVIPKEPTVHGGKGNTTDLVCIVHGHPKPIVHWGIEDRKLQNNNKYSTMHNAGHKYVLTVHNVTEKDFGHYYCNASNVRGTNYTTVWLTGLPGTPYITSHKSGFNLNDYIITWETESTSPILQYRLRYREKTDNITILHGPGHWHDSLYSPKEAIEMGLDNKIYYKNADRRKLANISHIPDGRLQPMVHTISKLDSEKEYQVTVAVENHFGWSQPSDLFYFHSRREVSVGHAATVTSKASIMRHTAPYCQIFLITLTSFTYLITIHVV